MKKLVLFFAGLSMLGSCGNETEATRKVLPKDKMILLLRDMHLSEAYVNANYAYSDSSKYIFSYLEDSVLKKHGTTKADFDSSMVYYHKDMKALDEIYAAAIDSLSLMEGLAK